MVFQFELLRVAIVLTGLVACSYYDLFNKRTVPNWLSYSFLALGVLSLVLAPSFNDALVTGGIAFVVFVFGYVLYQSGQIGGADVLAFTAITLLIPEFPALLHSAPAPAFPGVFQLPFVLSLFAVSGLLFLIFIVLSHLPRILRGLASGRLKVKASSLPYFALLMMLYMVLCFTYSYMGVPVLALIPLSLIVFAAGFVWLFKEEITDSMVEVVSPSKFDEEDVLAIERMDPMLVKKYDLKKLLTLDEIKRLKKLPIKKFPVYKNMPVFMPYILIAFVLILVFGDPLSWLTGYAMQH